MMDFFVYSAEIVNKNLAQKSHIKNNNNNTGIYQ